MISWAFLIACMQQTAEHQGRPWATSREPTHWMKATERGVSPFESRRSFPPVGPEALIIRSSSRLVITSGSSP